MSLIGNGSGATKFSSLYVGQFSQRSVKGKGGDRLARRARDASSLFREIILSDAGYKIIRDDNPSVVMVIEPRLMPAEGLNIDYLLADDQLVGIATEYQRLHPDADVRVLTHDTGPMATARTVGVGLAPIPDEWLRPPETVGSRQNYQGPSRRGCAPQINGASSRYCSCRRQQGRPDHRGRGCFLQRSNAPESLRSKWREFGRRFRLLTIFSTPKPPEQPGAFFEIAYEAASELGKSVNIALIIPHGSLLARKPRKRAEHLDATASNTRCAILCFEANNRGTRPARDVLVTISAKGNFDILPIQELPEGTFLLPSCPTPPRGLWGPPRIRALLAGAADSSAEPHWS